jgi:RimJ/RimL family protein N-acetyltransferase
VGIELRPVSAGAAQAILAGREPDGLTMADDYPTEFSRGIAQAVGGGSPLGPFFLCRSEDGVAVGEIGGGFTGDRVVEIGYAVVTSCWGRGYATEAVRALIELARAAEGIDLMVAHTPLDRPQSGRVLEKAGFTATGEVDDEHEGVTMRVRRWELAV